MGEMARLSDDISMIERIDAKASDARVLWELASSEHDEDAAAEAAAEVSALEQELSNVEVVALLAGEFDDYPAIVEIHAGEGGTDSQDWAEMLLRMYLRWAENRLGQNAVHLLEATPGEEAGLKSATFIVR